MNFLRSLLFNILYVVWTAGLAIVCMPLTPFRRRYLAWQPHVWAKVSLFLARWVCGIRYEIRGAENCTKEACIYAFKHQSAWDILIALTLFPNCAFVLKKELLRIPLYGRYLTATDMIAIDRSKGASSIKHMVKQAKEAAAIRRPIVIYPEGTRTLPGAETEYHPGIAALYSQLGVPVIPAALNSGYFWRRNAFTKRPGKVIVQFLPAIAPGLPPRELVTTLQPIIEQASHKLLAEAQAVL